MRKGGEKAIEHASVGLEIQLVTNKKGKKETTT